MVLGGMVVVCKEGGPDSFFMVLISRVAEFSLEEEARWAGLSFTASVIAGFHSLAIPFNTHGVLPSRKALSRFPFQGTHRPRLFRCKFRTHGPENLGFCTKFVFPFSCNLLPSRQFPPTSLCNCDKPSPHIQEGKGGKAGHP